MEQLREAFTLQVTVPEIRARILDDTRRMMHLMTEALARRTGRAPDDLAVRTFAGAVFGVMTSASLPYHKLPEGGVASTLVADLFERIDEALGMFEAGLPLLLALRGPRAACAPGPAGMMTCHVLFWLLAARCAGYGCLI